MYKCLSYKLKSRLIKGGNWEVFLFLENPTKSLIFNSPLNFIFLSLLRVTNFKKYGEISLYQFGIITFKELNKDNLFLP